MQDLPTFHAPTRQAWREWLLENHQKADNIWLIIYKKDSPTTSVYYDEAVDEALCFGWIDSSVKKRDAESFMQFFSKRKPKSNWSKVNKEKVGKLIEAGLMHESGQAMIDLAKKTGTWTALDEVESLTFPTDLQQALDANPTAKGYFEAFPRSVKRGILEWLFNAKQAQTRQKRIEEIVTLAERNERANQYKPKTS
ncbi:MAG: hypothetical protein EAZ95_10025 [Bacteroidetes bacterium]|nr:MAG: hypothetical protein EAZ95_10025 [Bacteroidota bacterium]